MSRFVHPLDSQYNKNGKPLDGAKREFFEPGLLVNKDTFSDEALTTPNTNPVIADGTGTFPEIWLNGNYDVTLKDKNDVSVGLNPLRVNDFATSSNATINVKTTNEMAGLGGLVVGSSVVQTAENSTGNGGSGIYDTITVGTTKYVDLPDTFSIIVSTVDSNVALKLRTDGIVNILSWGVIADGSTDTSTAMADAMASPVLSFRFPEGVYVTQVNNGTSERTFYFEEGSIIDGVIHITGVGPATTPPATLSTVDNVRMIGTATTTIRFGTFYCNNLFVDKIHQLAPDGIFPNQTISGATGVHLFFGTKTFRCNEIIVEDANTSSAFTADQGVVKGVDELQEDNYIGRLVIKKLTGVTGIVTAENKNLRIDEIVMKQQSGAFVGWISVDDINLKVGKITHDGLGADSGQDGIFLNNTDVNSSAEFGTVDVRNVPGIAFRTFSVGTVHINNFIGNTNREHARIQSLVTIDNFEGDASSEIGLNFQDGFAKGSYVGRANLVGTAGTGIHVGSDDITVDYAKCDGFAALFGLNISAVGIKNFNNDYYEAANCSQGFRCVSAGPINMGVMNIHDNTTGIVGSAMSDFGFDYVIYANNGTDTNIVLEALAGFRGKKVRQSVSADRGDASVTLTVGVDQITQRFATTLTAARTVTLSTTNATNGDKFRISRTAAGAFNLSTSGTLNNKALAASEWVVYQFQGSNWDIIEFGSL